MNLRDAAPLETRVEAAAPRRASAPAVAGIVEHVRRTAIEKESQRPHAWREAAGTINTASPESWPFAAQPPDDQ